jgi:hypothetical protein
MFCIQPLRTKMTPRYAFFVHQRASGMLIVHLFSSNSDFPGFRISAAQSPPEAFPDGMVQLNITWIPETDYDKGRPSVYVKLWNEISVSLGMTPCNVSPCLTNFSSLASGSVR